MHSVWDPSEDISSRTEDGEDSTRYSIAAEPSETRGEETPTSEQRAGWNAAFAGQLRKEEAVRKRPPLVD